MIHLTFPEFIYYGVLLVSLILYLTLYVRNSKEIIYRKQQSTRWGIVASFAVIGIVAAVSKMIDWRQAALSALIACLIAYYVVFIKYKK